MTSILPKVPDKRVDYELQSLFVRPLHFIDFSNIIWPLGCYHLLKWLGGSAPLFIEVQTM
jgi:hypothetical protein